ncbi:MAG: BTAD domain-containing putative transcriptional regulator, partial [bacterium]
RGLSRDQILGYLWPDGESGAARHSLEQLLHTLRRTLGDSVFAGVNPIALNRDVVRSDVAEFEQALSRDDFAAAIALYRGPFLSGFYLDNAREFERWVEGERARLGGRYLEALLRLSERAEQNGDLHAAVEWRKRVVEADPLSSRCALQYMRALAAAGDRAAALAHARVHEQLVRQELEADVDPSIAAYATALRDGVGEPASGPPPPDLAADVVSNDASERAAPREVMQGRSKVPRRPWMGRRLVVAMGATVAVIALASWALVRRMALPPRDTHAIVIVPFRIVSADSSWKNREDEIADLLSLPLTGKGGLRAIDARTAISAWKRVSDGRDGTADDARRVARELGAGQALFGTLVRTPTELTLSANVLDPDGGERQPLVSVTAPVDSIHALIDAFVRQLLGRRSGMPEQTLATLTTVSTPALFAYLDGRIAYRQAHDAEAIRDFARALEIDSTFALAGLDLAVATLKILRQQRCNDHVCRFATMVPGLRDATSLLDDSRFDAGIRSAWAAHDKLVPRDRALLNALRGRHYP